MAAAVGSPGALAAPGVSTLVITRRHTAPCRPPRPSPLRRGAAAAAAAAAGAAPRGRRAGPRRPRALRRAAAAEGDAAAAPAEERVAPPGQSSLKDRAQAWWRKYAKVDRKQLSKMGLMCFLSYGFISNANMAVLVTASAYSAMSATGASPLASSAALRQFGITYAALYVFSNLIRPLRVALAVTVSPAFDRLVAAFQRRLGCKKWAAIVLTVLLTNVAGTLALMSGGLFLASKLTGVPVSIASFGALAKAGKAARSAA